MADCSCDYCSKENICEYAYQSSDCLVISIRDAKMITGFSYFRDLYEIIESKRDTMDSVVTEAFLNAMQEIMYYAAM